MLEIVIATGNLNKLREFREMFKTFKNVDFLSLLNFPHYRLPEETGKTFLENAILKAEHAAKHLNKWVIADDSGLVVPALEGSPGIYSARYAGEGASDKENRTKLLHALKGKKDLERSAYFECALALAAPDGTIKKTVTGLSEGLLLEQERGTGGFGYDALFVKYDYDKSFAELDENVKNRISHRAKAIEKLRPALDALERELKAV